MTTPSLASTDNSASAIYSSWLRQFLPGLGVNIQGTATPGIDVSGCSTAATCGLIYYSAPANTVAASTSLLRLQRNATYSGGTSGNTVKSLWVLTYTAPNGKYYEWPITSELHNETAATTAAQNVAVNGTAFKQYPSGSTNQIGPTWGGNFVCNDQTGLVNPTNSCIGAELDSYTVAGAGTDVNKERVGLQITEGPTSTDTGVHIGRGILLGATNGGIIDNAVEIDMSNGTNSFLINGSGATTINSPLGGWSGFNVGKQLVVTTPINQNNPSIGISDLNDTNFWALVNYGGTLEMQAMPALNNNSTVAVTAVSLPRNGVGGIQLPVVTVAALPNCNTLSAGTLLGISDSATTTFNSVLTGGGTNRLLAYCNSSNWVAH